MSSSAPSATLRRRRNQLLAAGLIDSLGLSIGWTAMSLHTVELHGLAAFGLLAAALWAGVALSAPFTGWLSSRMDGRRLLRTTAVGEGALRAVGFAALLLGAPLWAVAVPVVAGNVLAWTGFAGMRAEVALLGGGAGWLSAYTAGIAAAEALGAFVAAFLPTGADGRLTTTLAVVVGAAYACSLVPTFVVARSATAPRATSGSLRTAISGRGRLLAGGAAVTLLATGPTLLAVGLATSLHGRAAVGPAMLLFAVGSLIGPGLASWVHRLPLPTGVVWCFLGVLMLAGWGVAPLLLVGLLAAQFVSGLALGAFEGVMDAAISEVGSRDSMTGGLAWAGATRALGSAVAVSAAPGAMAVLGVDRTAATATVVLAAAAVVAGVVAAAGGRRGRLRTERVADEFVAAPHDTPADWVLVVTPDTAEFRVVAERFFGVEVCRAESGTELREAAPDLPPPVQVVVSSMVPDVELLAIEAMVERDGPWDGTRVRLLPEGAPAEPAPVEIEDLGQEVVDVSLAA